MLFALYSSDSTGNPGEEFAQIEAKSQREALEKAIKTMPDEMYLDGETDCGCEWNSEFVSDSLFHVWRSVICEDLSQLREDFGGNPEIEDHCYVAAYAAHWRR